MSSVRQRLFLLLYLSAGGFPSNAHALRGPLVVEPRTGALVLNGVPGTGMQR